MTADNLAGRLLVFDGTRATTGDETRWWQSPWLWLALALGSLVPFLAAPLPPLGDLLTHMARYQVMLDGEQSPFLRQYFRFRWMVAPNMGQDLLMVVAGPLLGVERGAIVLAALLPPLQILLIRQISKAVHGAVQPTALLAVPFVYSYTYLYGFMNFHTGITLALAAILFWYRTQHWSELPRATCLLVLAAIVWLAHLAAWGVLVSALAMFELAVLIRDRNWSPGYIARRIALAGIPVLLPALLLLLGPASEIVTAAAPPSFALKLKISSLGTPLRDEVKLLDLASLALLLAVPAGLLLFRQARLVLSLALVAAFLFVAFWLIPTNSMSGFYADTRLVSVMWIFALVAVRFEGQARTAGIVAAFAVALFGVRVAATAHGWAERGKSLNAELGALRYIPEGARIASMAPARGCYNAWYNDSLAHLPSLAIVRRNAFVTTYWDIPGQQLMVPIYLPGSPYNGAMSFSPHGKLRADGTPCSGVDTDEWLMNLPRDRFDFLWTFQIEPPEAARQWLELKYAGPNGKLYAIRH
ncbi:MAG TPA: hypothetical protein VF481_18650 [Novosphingobium sp.]